MIAGIFQVGFPNKFFKKSETDEIGLEANMNKTMKNETFCYHTKEGLTIVRTRNDQR